MSKDIGSFEGYCCGWTKQQTEQCFCLSENRFRTRVAHPSSWLPRGIWESLDRLLAYSSSIFILRGEAKSFFYYLVFHLRFWVEQYSCYTLVSKKMGKCCLIFTVEAVSELPPGVDNNKKANTESEGDDTFLVWTLPSLSASASPSAVCAARPQNLWDTHCSGCPSCPSARWTQKQYR